MKIFLWFLQKKFFSVLRKSVPGPQTSVVRKLFSHTTIICQITYIYSIQTTFKTISKTIIILNYLSYLLLLYFFFSFLTHFLYPIFLLVFSFLLSITISIHHNLLRFPLNISNRLILSRSLYLIPLRSLLLLTNIPYLTFNFFIIKSTQVTINII